MALADYPQVGVVELSYSALKTILQTEINNLIVSEKN